MTMPPAIAWDTEVRGLGCGVRGPTLAKGIGGIGGTALAPSACGVGCGEADREHEPPTSEAGSSEDLSEEDVMCRATPVDVVEPRPSEADLSEWRASDEYRLLRRSLCPPTSDRSRDVLRLASERVVELVRSLATSKPTSRASPTSPSTQLLSSSAALTIASAVEGVGPNAISEIEMRPWTMPSASACAAAIAAAGASAALVASVELPVEFVGDLDAEWPPWEEWLRIPSWSEDD